ncbi:MAG: 2,3-bisphosphoglycerate-dependent phosphoglycerate mutase [Candidatus Saccharimonas sp.]|nr:2,3-bisphosphoglycerate-dependent phosphoglycerate mutase [Candidatus Saccharimonas sp.]
MAVIVFYEATKMDEQQLSAGLQPTDHQWDFVRDTISLRNIDKNAEVISVFVASQVTRQMIEKMPRLKLIATRSTGFDHIDLETATARGITVVNVPTYGENTVAEATFSLMLALTRKLIPTVSTTRKGTFIASDLTGVDLKGRTLGVIGMGHIGRHTAKIAKGFEMDVIAYDVHQDAAFAKSMGIEYVAFDDLLSRSDIITLHTPLLPDNYHLINQSTIAKMKKGAILINTARGELVENRALIHGVKSGHLAGAGLDTIEGEKLILQKEMIGALNSSSTSPTTYEHAAEVHTMLQIPNIIITQHAAFNTEEAIARINDTTVQNITRFWYGETPNRVQAKTTAGKLVIVRHTESEWNAEGLWTGTTDVHLSKKGWDDAAKIGAKLSDIAFDYAFTSQQIRSHETLEAIKNAAGKLDLHSESSAAINERDYGVYTGMNKDKVHESIGDEAFDILRRSWDVPVEGGESLRDVYQRTIPFYLRVILPRIRHGQNVLIIAHGNSIRSLIKYIEDVSDQKIGDTEMPQDDILIYEVDFDGHEKTKSAIKV